MQFLRVIPRAALAGAIIALLAAPIPASAQVGKFLKDRAKKAAIDKAAKAIAPKPSVKDSVSRDSVGRDSVAGDSVARDTTAAAGKPVAGPATLWVNYDFVPGERVILYTDYSDDVVGNFPQRLEFLRGNMEVAERAGVRMIRATNSSAFTIPLPEVLPQRFTIEIDFVNRQSLDGNAFELQGGAVPTNDRKTSTIRWGSNGVSMDGGGGGEVPMENNEANRVRYRGKPGQLRILGDGKYIKVFLDEQRVVNVPNANFERSKALSLVIDARSQENSAFVGRIRVAESRKSIYDDLTAKGRVSTQGILFSTGSDKLQPESAPTLKEIAGMLKAHPELRLSIEGHTDNVGPTEANLDLSGRRAAVVKGALVSDYLIDAARLESQGFGDAKPVAKNTTPEGRQNNRRVELVKLP